MLESFIPFLESNAEYAHFIVFGLLMLAGFNVPISEDLMIIVSAFIAATIVPENTLLLFLGVFLGAYISDWTAYWIGRKLGRKLFEHKWFSKAVPEKKLLRIQDYYKRYGVLTLLIGRFIPFGVRNCLFMTAGLGKMDFLKFLLADGVACLISNSVLFYLTYQLGKNYLTLIPYLKNFNMIIFLLFIVTLIAAICYKRVINRQKIRS